MLGTFGGVAYGVRKAVTENKPGEWPEDCLEVFLGGWLGALTGIAFPVVPFVAAALYGLERAKQLRVNDKNPL